MIIRNIAEPLPAPYSAHEAPDPVQMPEDGNERAARGGRRSGLGDSGDARVGMVSSLWLASFRQHDDGQAARRPERPAGACEGRRLSGGSFGGIRADANQPRTPMGVPRPIVRYAARSQPAAGFRSGGAALRSQLPVRGRPTQSFQRRRSPGVPRSPGPRNRNST